MSLVIRRVDGCRAWCLSLLVSAACCYCLTLAANFLYEAYLEAEIDQYDKNGDGFLFDEQLTPRDEQRVDQLSSDWASDTGRTFAPCTGLVIWPIYAGFWHALIGGISLPFIANRRSGTGPDDTSSGV